MRIGRILYFENMMGPIPQETWKILFFKKIKYHTFKTDLRKYIVQYVINRSYPINVHRIN